MKNIAEETRQMNKMGTANIKKLMLSMGLPIIVSMALQAVYNIVDSYFVSCMPDTAEVQHMGSLSFRCRLPQRLPALRILKRLSGLHFLSESLQRF